MDLKTFKAEVQKELVTSSVDITHVSKWFETALSSLKTLHSQKAGISHPRHRGDAREANFFEGHRANLSRLYKTQQRVCSK
jgi:hypothetical protein